ncbi:GldM family protein [Epilithonimonas xixisoli]|uniref:Gliding motility-associated protein GldM n=1 Tax=Epilithonimonas xixisoli TaxID=1476462 RepID=A0A4R8I3J3_9FLAO|nr:GldM family protein [Epilithonimonas xixisoli]TDX82864.1 gliding motility-associated protein GldM [Epilithonimonas xixisoli]
MAGGKQTPRQKMINLMYLVFIAMLAMQIDQEIIRSYKDTNDSLTNTRTNIVEEKNKIFYTTLKAKAATSPEIYGPLQGQYEELSGKTDALVGLIEKYKQEMSAQAEYNAGLQVEESFTALNNTEPATVLFFTDGDEKKISPKSTELKSKVDDLRNFIVTSFSNNQQLKSVADRATNNLLADFPKGDKRANSGKNWFQYKFYNQPLIAALSNLELIQSEARNLQADAVAAMLQEKVDADIKFDAYEALVSGPSSVMKGEPAQIKVAIGTFASSVPGLAITGAKVVNGQGIITPATGAVGTQELKGTVSFTDKNGKVHSLPYAHTLNVVSGAEALKEQSGAILAADKMNVLYRGLSNPVSGSILGANLEATTLSAAGASVSGGKGKWNVTPSGANEVTLTIAGKSPSGKTISQPFKFRVKNIPPPRGEIRGKSYDIMPANMISKQTLTATLKDFDFPVSFNVVSFKVKVPGKAVMSVNGNSLAPVESLTKGLRSGDNIAIFDVQATAQGLSGVVLPNIGGVVISVL